MADFAEVSLLLVFTDLLRHAAQTERRPDAEVAGVMADYYDLAGSRVTAAGGRVVKFIGDAMLAVFPPDRAEAGIVALLGLKDAADAFMVQRGWDCRLTGKAHFGRVAEGLFPVGADRRYDVLGKAVNLAARLDSRPAFPPGRQVKRRKAGASNSRISGGFRL